MANDLPLHQAALAWARQQEGKGEVPPGSNTGPFVRLCQSCTWLAGSRWPWCVAFVQAAWKLGAKHPLPWRGAGAYAFYDWALKAGWTVRLEDAVPGDALIWNEGSGHCSMLELPYTMTHPLIHSIDGNVSNMVAQRSRPRSMLRGAIHIPEHPTVLRPKPPVFEVVGSSSGHSKLVYASGAKAVGKKLPALLNRFGGLTIRRRKR